MAFLDFYLMEVFVIFEGGFGKKLDRDHLEAREEKMGSGKSCKGGVREEGIVLEI